MTNNPAKAWRELPGDALDRLLSTLDTLSERLGKPGAALGYFMLAPAALILTVFALFPIFYSIYLSFFSDSGGAYVGAANYREALTGEEFWDSFAVTVYYAVGTVPTSLVLSFLIANALFRITRFRATLRLLYFLPYVTSMVAAAIIWRVMLEPTEGMANLALDRLGIPAQNWLLEPRGILHLLHSDISPSVGPSLALCSIILFEIWRSCGFMVVVFLAGLSAIPRDLEDAARIDGANAGRVAWNITLPLLSPTIFFLVIVGVIGSFQAFSGIYAMTGTGHGPLDTTQNLTVYIYANYFEYQRQGYGAAVATLLAAAIMLLTLAQWRLFGRRVYYS